MKTAVIDVGGGLRGVYAAGIFDRFIEENISFDVCIGISAGSANITSFIAGQKGRNYPFYTDYPFRREYMGISNWLKNRNYLNLDYIYSTLSNSGGENPLDYDALIKNPSELVIIACNALTGETVYFGKDDIHQDDYEVLKASSAIPTVCHPYSVGGILCFDGALADTIPLDKAFAMGCDRIVLILTKPVDEIRTVKMDKAPAFGIKRKYPKAAERLLGRAERYNKGVERALKLEKEGKVFILSPENTEGVDTLTKDRDALKRLYRRGYEDARKAFEFLDR